MSRVLVTLVVVSTVVCLEAQSLPPDLPVFPRELEMELALNAAPPHLRDGASVLVFERAGYVKVRDGRNGFTCIVSRRGGDVFPVCWDPEGTNTLVRIETEAATLRLAGHPIAEIQRKVEEGFKNGTYRAPKRGGVAYMLSPLRYRIDDTGRATGTNAVPHVMFYGPNVTDADIGGQRGSPLFMNRVGPEGMIIVPVGSSEREAIARDSQSLTQRVEHQLGVGPRR